MSIKEELAKGIHGISQAGKRVIEQNKNLGDDFNEAFKKFVESRQIEKKRIPVKLKLGEGAVMPKYGREGDACFDLATTSITQAVIDGPNGAKYWGCCNGDLADWQTGHVEIKPDSSAVFDTRNFFQIPPEHVMMVFGRSGHGFNFDISLSNCVGIIDSNYRGSVQVKLRNDSNKSYRVRGGERIAQALVIPVSQVEFLLVDELDESNRGEDGFGSSGKV